MKIQKNRSRIQLLLTYFHKTLYINRIQIVPKKRTVKKKVSPNSIRDLLTKTEIPKQVRNDMNFSALLPFAFFSHNLLFTDKPTRKK